MALITKPDMEFIWASGGAIVEPSDVKKQTGWTPEVPPHQWENWIQNRQDNYLAWAVVPEEQPILLKELGTEPVLMFLAQSVALAVFGLTRVLWDNVKSQLGNGC